MNSPETEVDFASEKVVTGKDMLDAIKHYLELNVQFVKNFVKESDAEFSMIFQIITSDMKSIVFPPELVGNLSKETISSVVKGLAKEYSAIAVIHVAEVWALQSGKKTDEKAFIEESRKYGSISNHPDRVECFNITASYNVQGKMKFTVCMYPIIRHDDGKRSLDEENMTHYETEKASGLFVIPPEFFVPIEP